MRLYAHRKLLQVAAGIVAVTALVVPRPAASYAEACTVGPYAEVLHPSLSLSAKLVLDIASDCPDTRSDVTVRTYLDVGKRRVFTPAPFRVKNVTTKSQRRFIKIPGRAIRRALRFGKATGHRRADLKIVLSGAPGGQATDHFIRLPKTAR